MKCKEESTTSKARTQIIFVVALCLVFFLCSLYIELETLGGKQFLGETELKKISKTTRPCNKSIDILLQFIEGGKDKKLQQQFYNFTASLLTQTNCDISLHVITDILGRKLVKDILQNIQSVYKVIPPKSSFIDASMVFLNISYITKSMYELFSNHPSTNSYYHRWYFYTSVALHRILPGTITKIIMLDIDMQFRKDVQDLYKHFHYMNNSHIIGLAREQQPVYAHVTWVYRERHKNTRVGDPPPYGLTGFNSGTKLMNLEAMRRSVIYNRYLDSVQLLKSLAYVYNFKGHLGDQDFYTLLSFQHMDLFYTLSCQWNRQLCVWWKKEAFKRTFDFYFNCTPPYYLIHGNCDTPIVDV